MTGSVRREPKYAAIAADLEAKIRSGQHAYGSALPPQRDLSTSYGVTLMTLRQALQVLTDRGLVTQHPGRGTFVSVPKAAYDLGSLHSLADDLRAQGHRVDTVLLSRARRRPPARIAEQLATGQPGTEPPQSALRIERLRRLAGAPAVHQVSWVPAPYAEPLRDVDFAVTSLYGALADQGVQVARAEERLLPAVLDATLGALLDRPAGTAVLISERVTYAGDAVVVVDRATILGDVIEIRTVRAASSMSVRWTNAGR
jgi:GntR family transcriptional regulator